MVFDATRYRVLSPWAKPVMSCRLVFFVQVADNFFVGALEYYSTAPTKKSSGTCTKMVLVEIDAGPSLQLHVSGQDQSQLRL